MTSTLAELREDIKQRLLIGTTSQESDDMDIDNWLRDAFKFAIGVVPPVDETTVSVTSTPPTATLVADEVYYVANGPRILIAGEWEKQGGTLKFRRPAAQSGDTVQAWYFLDPDITSSTTSVDTSCTFGTDWLESVVIKMVMQEVEVRASNTAVSASAADHAGMVRVFQEQWLALLAPYQQRWAAWEARMERRLQQRLTFSDLPAKEHSAAGWRNRSRKIPITGEQA
jgi:hypothetical protein